MTTAERREEAPQYVGTTLERVAQALPTMRRSERNVAELVLSDPVRVVNLTMAGLAEAAGVSEPTVMRFSASVGCSGFQDFKIQLAQTLALGLPLTHSGIEAGDSGAALSEKIFDHTISSLDRARRTLDHDAVERAIDLLHGASDVLFVGFGASGIIAQDAQQKFPLFGVPCQAPADFHQQFIAATMGGPRSVTVAISNTGSTSQVLTVARAAKAAGSPVIALTGQPGALSDLADVALVVQTFEDTDIYTPTTSRLAGLVVIDVLATGVALRRPAEHREAIHHMKNELAAMRKGAAATAADSAPATE